MRNSIIILLLVCCTHTIGYTTNLKNENETSINQTNSITTPIYKIGFEAPTIDHRQLLLGISEETTVGLDWGYDAEMYEVLMDDMYWLIEDTKCVIQGYPKAVVDVEIPIGIIMSETGSIAINMDEVINPLEEFVVYLKDKELNKLYNIQDSTFQTTLSQGEHHSRFVLTFKSKDFVNEPKPEPPVEENPIICNSNNPKVKVFYNHKNSSLEIRNKCEIEISNILLFNRYGSLVKSWDIQTVYKHLRLPVQARKGIYYAIVNSEVKAFKKKLLIH